ncbi:MAG: extracellular solute-binding protein [Pseudomonadota bacterium]
MQHPQRRTSKSKGVAKTADLKATLAHQMAPWALGGLVFLGAAGYALGENHETIIKSHGYSEYGALKYGPDFPHLDYVNPDAPKGGDVALAIVGKFDGMNPYATQKGQAGALSTVMYERMMTSTSDEVSGSYCFLCETLEYPEDESWVIFNLRKDVTFSDGTPLTAHDILYTHNLLKTQGTPSYASFVSVMVPQAEALDDHTLKFTFAEDQPKKDLIAIVGSTPAWSKAWYEKTGYRLDEQRLEIGPGTGPYMLVPEELDVGRSITYRRNPDYWGQNTPFGIGRWNYDELRIEYFGDTAGAFEAFKSGDVNVRLESSSRTWATQYEFPAIDKGWVKKEALKDGALKAAGGFVFNMKKEKFADPRVREAIGLMYNFTWTNEELQFGLFQQREAFYQNELVMATGLPEGRELELLETVRDILPESIFTEPAVLPHKSGKSPLDRRNRAKAEALLIEAGYEPGARGQLLKDGKPLVLEFLSDNAEMDRLVLPFVDNLKALGVDATYARVDEPQYKARVDAKDFDMISASYRVFLEDSSAGIEQRYGCADRDDVFNAGAYCNPAIDKLRLFLNDAETYDEVRSILKAIDRVLRSDRFLILTWTQNDNWIAYYDMFEYPENLPPFGLGYRDYWWINPEKQAALEAAGAFR